MEFLTPTEQTYTKWHNPTAHTVIADVYVGGLPKAGTTARVRYVFKPGETKTVMSNHAAAFHSRHNGTIVGGLAPQLVQLETDEVQVLHPALDSDLVAKQEAEARMAEAEIQRRNAQQAALIAEAARLKAEDATAAKQAKIEEAKKGK